MKKKYNWSDVQKSYDSGLSTRDLASLYGMSSATLTKACRRGDLVCRNRSDAAKIEQGRNPRSHTEAFKDKQRENIILRYENGWMPKAGRCKKYLHQSPIAGSVYLDGTWELKVAEWLDTQNIIWRRNTKRFSYTNLKGKLSHYTPDFWIEGWGVYLEVKGYETALDRCKWSQFSLPLIVWRKKEILELRMRG